MKDLLAQLLVYKNTASLSDSLSDFSLDTETIQLNDTDYLYLGRETPFYAFYFYASTYNTNSSSIKIEYYYNGSWREFLSSEIIDDTKGFSRAGFVQFEAKDQNQITINSLKKYWYRLSVSDATTSMTVKAINILFSDDSDLQREYYPITRSDFKMGASDYVLLHESVRDSIVQKFRNRGLRRINTNFDYKRIVAWDLLDIQEVRLASTHFVLSRIFEQVSDNPEDKWRQKSLIHDKMANEFLNIAYLTFDKSSDGDTQQQASMSQGYLYR